MESVLEKELFNCFTQLNEVEKKSLLSMMKKHLAGRKDNAGRISIEQYNKELDEAMAEAKRGEVYSHEEVLKMAKDW
jgi:predicted transcriptional regulator